MSLLYAVSRTLSGCFADRAGTAQLEKILENADGPVNLFKFIVNPNDFGQSVENMFYLSFLIRDGKCAFEIEEETGEPVISRSPRTPA